MSSATENMHLLSLLIVAVGLVSLAMGAQVATLPLLPRHVEQSLARSGRVARSSEYEVRPFIYIQHILYYNFYFPQKNAYTVRCMNLLSIIFYRSTKTKIKYNRLSYRSTKTN